MHEHSLVRTLLGHVDRLCKDHGGASVCEVHVQIGPLSGVEPLLVTSAFEQLRDGTSAAHAQLVIKEVPLEVRCSYCAEESEVQDFRFRCGRCGHDDVRVVRGDEFQLVSVTLDSTDPCPQTADVMP
jgi:hydrogenase nickel incorporation protein HypA/HybF